MLKSLLIVLALLAGLWLLLHLLPALLVLVAAKSRVAPGKGRLMR